MNKVLGWGLTIFAGGVLIWQIASSAPVVPIGVSAVLLAILSLLAGMRIGVTGATAYIHDVQRLNKVLAEQHHDLEDLNAKLLQQLTAQSEEQTAEQNLT